MPIPRRWTAKGDRKQMAIGKKTGGRKAGTPNKATAAKAAEIAASGLTPLDYMLQVMRNPEVDPHRRDEMAKAAAPYVHPRLIAAEVELGTIEDDPIIEFFRSLSGSVLRPKAE